MAKASSNPSSARLELVPISIEMLDAFSCGLLEAAAEALGAEIEPGCLHEDDVAFFRRRLLELAEDPDLHPWTVRAIVLREPARMMIGHIGFHGPPGVNGPGIAGAVEIGYTVFPISRGLGYATEAASALIGWASRSHGIRHFIASVAPGNAPSEAIVAKLGFTHTGERRDEDDGLEYVYEAFLA